MNAIASSTSPARTLWNPEKRDPLLQSILTLIGPVHGDLFSKLMVATAGNDRLLGDLSQTRRWERYWRDRDAVRNFPDFETLGHTMIVVDLARQVVSAGISQGALTQEEASKILVAMLTHDFPEVKTKDKLYMLQSAAGDRKEVEVFQTHKFEWWSRELEAQTIKE